MAHGYMRDYDDDDDRGETRDRNVERGNQRNREFMIGDRHRDWDDERNRNFDRREDFPSGDDGREWFGGNPSRSQRSYGSNQDDHYRSWRNKQMEALDRDYADYCREREQQFHSDFDSWRSQRRENVQPLRTGMTQTGRPSNPEGMPDIATDLETSAQGRAPMADATVGTAPNSNRRS